MNQRTDQPAPRKAVRRMTGKSNLLKSFKYGRNPKAVLPPGPARIAAESLACAMMVRA